VFIAINWDLFVPGTSVFIPAVDLKRLHNQMQFLAQKHEIKVKGTERIEGGLLGMRFWRLS
jgi:hypothetical protein